MSEYHPDPALQDTPLPLSELETYVSQPGIFLKDGRKISHLLSRVLATVQLYKSQIQSLHHDIQDMRVQGSRTGVPSTLSPRDAVKYLSAQELTMLVEGTAKAMLLQAQRFQKEAQEEAKKTRAEQAKARFLILSVLEDQSISIDLRKKLQAELETMPQEITVGKVTDSGVPESLESLFDAGESL